MKKTWLRFIGDIHGQYPTYRKIIKNAQYTIQIGDMGFEYDWMEDIDVDRHRFIAGNHDNFMKLPPHYLGRYGVYEIPEWGSFFYLSGGKSVDSHLRVPYVSWWPEEEVSFEEGLKALELYKETKPEVVVSHECPLSIVSYVSDPTFLLHLGLWTVLLKSMEI